MKKKCIAMIALGLIIVLLLAACAPKEAPPAEEQNPQTPPVVNEEPSGEQPEDSDAYVPKEGWPLIEIGEGDDAIRIGGEQAKSIVELFYFENMTEADYVETPSDAMKVRVTEGVNDVYVIWVWQTGDITYRCDYNVQAAEDYKAKDGEYPPVFVVDNAAYDQLIGWMTSHQK